MARLLLVEDDVGVAELLALALRSLGHDTRLAHDGAAGLLAAASGEFDAMILDVMMPGLDGFETCRRLRATSQLPVIMLTARSDAIDVVTGLELGADDYVIKPVEPRVLDARLKAVLRRAQAEATASGVLVVGDLRIDPDAFAAWRSDVPLALSATETKLLIELARNVGRVLTRRHLLTNVWEYGYAGDSRLVDAAIQRLRVKIEPDPADPTYIHTVRGTGYRMDRP